MVATTKTKKRGCQPAKPLSEKEREKLRQSVLEWHNATCATLSGLAAIAVDLLDELSNCQSPLHEFFGQPNDLQELIRNLNDSESSVTYVLARESLTTTANIPNPCDLIRRDEK